MGQRYRPRILHKGQRLPPPVGPSCAPQNNEAGKTPASLNAWTMLPGLLVLERDRSRGLSSGLGNLARRHFVPRADRPAAVGPEFGAGLVVVEIEVTVHRGRPDDARASEVLLGAHAGTVHGQHRIGRVVATAHA